MSRSGFRMTLKSMKKIVHVPHLVLTTPASPVTVFDRKLLTLIADMKETLLAATNPKGVGLAATQVGVGLRLFLTRPTEKAKIRAFINPEIINSFKDSTDGVPERGNPPSREASDGHSKLEGCLSIPNVWGNVKRASALTLRYQDEKGGIHEEKFSGFMATIIQHETDHINGILYPQRVLEQNEKLYEAVFEDGKEVLEEIKLT